MILLLAGVSTMAVTRRGGCVVDRLQPRRFEALLCGRRWDASNQGVSSDANDATCHDQPELLWLV